MKVAVALATIAVAGSVSAAPAAGPQIADVLESRTTFVPPVLTGYQAPVSWGKGVCAINAPSNTYLGSVWVGDATDYNACAVQCSALTVNDATSAKANTLFNSCNYFTAYQLYDGSNFLGTQCGLYTRNMQGDETTYDQNCGNGKINLKNVVSYGIVGYVGNNAATTNTYRSDLNLNAAAAVKARVAAAAVKTTTTSSSSSTTTTSKAATTSNGLPTIPGLPSFPSIPSIPSIPGLPSIPTFGFKAVKSAASAKKAVAKATPTAKKH